MNRRFLLFMMAAAALMDAGPGWARSYGIQVKIENKVGKVRDLPGASFDETLVFKLLKHLDEDKRYDHWDFGETKTSDFHLYLQVLEGAKGQPREILLRLELFEGKKSLTGWSVLWRRPSYKEGFDNPEDSAQEAMDALLDKDRGGPLATEALADALMDEVPLGFGAWAQSAMSIVTSLPMKRYDYLSRSAFEVHCSSSVQTWLECNGARSSHPFKPSEKSAAPYPGLVVSPVCIYDDGKGRRKVGPEDNVTNLTLTEIYLRHFVGKRELLHFVAEKCR